MIIFVYKQYVVCVALRAIFKYHHFLQQFLFINSKFFLVPFQLKKMIVFFPLILFVFCPLAQYCWQLLGSSGEMSSVVWT